MKSKNHPVHIPTPCPKRWEELQGGTQTRFCDHCQQSVHHLSHMTATERTALLSDPKGKPCVAFETDAKGRFISHVDSTLPGGLRRLRVFFVTLATAIIPFAFSSCAHRLMGAPAPITSADCKEVKKPEKTETAEADGKYMIVGAIVDPEEVPRPLWKRILWPF